MFDNYDIQDALSKAKDVLRLFEKDKNTNALSDAIKKLDYLLLINDSRMHLQRYEIKLRTMCELGRLYQYKYDTYGNKEDLFNGVDFFERAECLMGEFHPDRPSTINDLGNLLLELFKMERNPLFIEKAIGFFREADEFYQKTMAFKSIDRSNRSKVLNDLGNGLNERYAAMGNRPDLNSAIDVFNAAIDLTREDSPDLPIILANLAICLRYRFSLDNEPVDLDNAIDIWCEALRLNRNPKNLPGIFSNLGEGLKYRYSYKYEHSNKELALLDLNKAIEFSQKAVNSSSIIPIDKAGYLSNLGGKLTDLCNFMKDSNKLEGASDALDRAIRAFNDAISLLPRGSRDRAGFLANLGRALRAKYNLTGDASFLLRSFYVYDEASKSLNSDSFIASIPYKIGTRKSFGDIDDMLIETALKLRELAAKDSSPNDIQELNWGKEAMVCAEGAKSSILVELLGRHNIPAPSSVPPDLIEKERKLLEELNKIDLMELSKFDEQTISKENPEIRSTRLRKREELSNELGMLWNKIGSYGSESKEYIALRRGDRASWEDLKNLVKDPSTALLSLFPLSEKTVLFLLRAGWEEPKILKIPIGREAQLDIWRRFRREVHLYDFTGQLKETWDRDLIPLLKETSSYLKGINQVIFSPSRFGCLLPWEALLQKAEVDINWTTIPNLKIWSLMEKYAVDNTGSVLVIGNPKGGDDLIHAEDEARQIAKLFGAVPLIGPQATKEMVLKCLPKANIAHFATHAYFSLENPLDSVIILADDVLTIREIIDLKVHLKLLVLSACETGMNSSLGGDEMAGFAQGFILSGARSMLVSLWEVDDLSTASLMLSFYKRWINDNVNNAEALSIAMEETRKRKIWENIYYWGAFTLVGDIFEYK
jgi:hypothetical protein